jgi:hypothetical protein
MAARAAHYRLDGASEHQLHATILHLVVRGDDVVGRYGRGGHLTGRMDGRLLTATLSQDGRDGRLNATFTNDFASFHGRVAFGEGAEEREITGIRVVR